MGENKKPGPPAPEIKGLPRGERGFCRAVALTGVPTASYAKSWPGRAHRFAPSTVHAHVLKLLGRADIMDGVAYYRSRMDTSPARIHFIRMDRAYKAHQRELILKIGKREVRTANMGGTPELTAKMKFDVVRRMRVADEPKINEAQWWSAEQIRGVIEARTKGLFSGSRAMDGTFVQSSGSEITPLEAMSPDEIKAYAKIFKPWRERLERLVITNPRKELFTHYKITYAVVVNNWGTSQVEDKIKLQHGLVLPIIQDALRDYAVRAGWLRAVTVQ